VAQPVTESEEYVLGSVLLDNNQALYACAQEGITEKSFFVSINKKIWRAIQALAHANKPIDPCTLAKQLDSDGVDIDADHLDKMMGSVMTIAHTQYHAEQVKDAERNRILQNIVQEVDADITNGAVVTDSLEKLSVMTMALHDRKNVEVYRMADLREDKIDQWENAQEHGFVGVPFSKPKINKYLGGWRKGVMGIIAGYRGEGKSTIIREEALNLAEDDYKVALFTLEDPVDIAAACIAGNKADVSVFGLDTGTIRPDALEDINAAWRTIGKLPIWIIGNSTSVSQISATARLLKMRFDIDMIFIDHIQFITPYRMDGASRNDTVAQYSGQIIQLAKSLDIPIVCASQLSRDSEKANRKPKLSDLRDSGTLEQDARQILLLYYDKEAGQHILEVAKNNFGQSQKSVYVKRQDGRQRFEEGDEC